MEKFVAYEELVITVQVILQVFGALAVVWGGWKCISEFQKPHKELEKKVSTMELNQNKDYKRLNRIEAVQNAQSILLIEIANHLVNGDDKEKLQKKADDLLECITKSEMENAKAMLNK